MSMDSTSQYLARLKYPLLGAAALLLYRFLYKRKKALRLPPGPPCLPIIGNAHLIPKEKTWLAFSAWSKQYGDIICFLALGKPTIILNSAQSIIDLLDRRGSIYADRPYLHMAERTEWKDALTLLHYNSFHHGMRKLMAGYLAPRKVAENVQPVTERMTARYLLKPLLESPDRFLYHIRNAIAATVVMVAYGHEVKVSDSEPDELVELAKSSVANFAQIVSPGAFLVETFPILKYLPSWLPGAEFKRLARGWRKDVVRLRDGPYQDVKNQLRSGTARASFAAEMIKGNDNPTAEEELMYKWAAATFYAAGADTSVASIASFFLAMILYPSVLKKAQDELDRVVGSSRLPNFSDRASLPYIGALVKEVHRWSPVLPLSVAHMSMEDDTYAGYDIPKGAILIANSWAALHDESLYPAPFEFMPERFMRDNNNANESDDDDDDNADSTGGNIKNMQTSTGQFIKNPEPGKFAFGYGRRECPGKHLADASIWIATATILAVYDISPVIDATTGQPKIPKLEVSSGLVSHPNDFECRITPRSDAAAKLVKAFVNVA